jgi:hypothetical protein
MTDDEIRQAIVRDLHPVADPHEWSVREKRQIIATCSVCLWPMPNHADSCVWRTASRLVPVVRRLIEQAAPIVAVPFLRVLAAWRDE